MTAEAIKWQANPACQPHWQHWNDSSVLFNASSGQTHFLNSFAYFAYELIAAADGISGDDLRARICKLDELENDLPLQQHVDQILATMDELGLIEPKR